MSLRKKNFAFYSVPYQGTKYITKDCLKLKTLFQSTVSKLFLGTKFIGHRIQNRIKARYNKGLKLVQYMGFEILLNY